MRDKKRKSKVSAGANVFVNVNELWGRLIAETLFRLGVRKAVIAPGSRSTPLALAFGGHPEIEAIPVLDERSASFYALGLARQNCCATVLVCTSGTAAANFFPAVIEARESGVPLIVLTADRPPEMRFCQSGQTIDQQKIYGHYPNFQAELALPSTAKTHLKHLRQMLAHAWDRSRYPYAGAVHLNVPFSDPLAPEPVPDSQAIAFDLESFVSHVGSIPPVEYALPDTSEFSFLKKMQQCRKGLIIVGPAQPDDPEAYATAIGKIAERLGWPVISDGLSPCRHYAKSNPYLVGHYDVFLRNRSIADQLVPEKVLSIGPLPVSKCLRSWLADHAIETTVLSAGSDNVDGLHREATPVHLSVETMACALADRVAPSSPWRDRWLALEKKTTRALDKAMRSCPFILEGAVVDMLSRKLPKGAPLFIANSMPIRDVENFWKPGNRRIRPYFNRGANGIDGTLSTALGMAHDNQSGVLLTGDLSLLHDTNGFLAGAKLSGHLTIVLINNEGSGIFEFLSVSGVKKHFEEYFAMPQLVSFEDLARAYRVEYQSVRTLDELEPLIVKLPKTRLRLLEINTNRKLNMKWRKTTFSEIAAELK